MNVDDVASMAQDVLDEICTVVVGKESVLRQVMASILAGGHVLFEDNPGLAKTLIARSFAQALGVDFRRIQFTPDLLPSDITGSYILHRDSNEFVLAPGPVFSNVILADEVNRATPKTQSALLEAMQEMQVSITGETLPLPEPFIVMATQNPIEYEGTFPLPEAQLDRFMIRVSVGYPQPQDEVEILRRRIERGRDDRILTAVCSAEHLMAMRRAVETDIVVDSDIHAYIVSLVAQTRSHASVYVGASPRGSLALMKLSRAWAALHRRDYVLPDDVKTFAVPALSHRIILRPEFWTRQASTAQVIESVLASTPVPKVS